MIIHSNAGIPAIRKGQIVYPETPEYMTERFMQMADLGINILGGCCGTTPRHIEALAIALRYRAEGGQGGGEKREAGSEKLEVRSWKREARNEKREALGREREVGA